MQHSSLEGDAGSLVPGQTIRFPVPVTPEPAVPGQAMAWFAINRERIVDQWLTMVLSRRRKGIDPAFARVRLDGFFRAIVASISAPADPPFIQRAIGVGLAGLYADTEDGLHDLRTGLADLLTAGLPANLHPIVDEPLERTITQLVWGYCQHATQPAHTPATDLVTGDDLMRRFLEQYPGLVTVTTIEHDRLVAGNEVSQALLGYSLDEFMTLDEQVLFGPETPEDDYDIGLDLIAGRIPIVQRMSTMRHRDGHMVPLAVRIWVLRSEDGTPTHLVTEFAAPPVAANGPSHWQQADKRFRHLAQLSHDALLVVAPDGTVRYASPSTERSLGVDPEAVIGSRFADLAVDEDRELIDRFLASLAAAPPRGTGETVVRMQRRDGLWRWFEVLGANLLDVHDFAGFSIQTRDITDRRHLEDLLNRQARLDSLTGLLNRRGLLAEVELSISRYESTGEKMALLFIDLDHFKGINDRHGHDTGDIVLTEMTHRLSETIGATSAAGRLGGDEFVVLLRDTSHTGAMVAAREILAALAEPIVLDGMVIPAGACIGIALTERPGQTTSSLLRAADAALYRAKSTRDGNPAMGHDRGDER